MCAGGGVGAGQHAGFTIHYPSVLGLRKLIEIKEKLAREKDRAVLHVLRKTLGEIERQPEPPSPRSSS